MIFLKVIILSLITIAFIANGNAVNINRLCEGIKHSEDVSVCLIESVEEMKKEYSEQFVQYQLSIGSKEERPYNRKKTIQLAKKAKLNWDRYLINECLVESAKFLRNSTGFNDGYNVCLIKNYMQRIKYYRSNMF
ncbi:hypothetical protein [Rosenbergiella nectarea]|uniref:hypothetical protein n=1 Tax=Rosenbergiella nectarea TaxID=988801 RepID=UPI001BDA68CF|nr:hypothetical protein [Rosenbergiella nectarea]MBT0731451.1 hypothetical protein [Rosenbergiella nectarea subsp. apis]